MTPLALQIAREMTMPVKRRTFRNPDVLALFEGDMHCFDVTAIRKPISDAMDASNVWPDVSSLLGGLFLPSPVTWLETSSDGSRVAWVVTKEDAWWRLFIVIDGNPTFGGPVARFRPCSILTSPDMVDVQFTGDENPLAALTKNLPEPESMTALPGTGTGWLAAMKDKNRALGRDVGKDVRTARILGNLAGIRIAKLQDELGDSERSLTLMEMCRTGIAFSVLAIDLINTPGLVGFRQHAPHAGLAKQLARLNAGRYPLRSWSEVTVKTHTRVCDGDFSSGATFRKCLHFVRSHQRHYRNGRVSVVPAHWRGDPALGIKRTRYRVTA